MLCTRRRMTVGTSILAIAAGVVVLASSASAASGARHSRRIDPADFTNKVDNPFMTWKPGTIFHYRSTEPGSTSNPVAVTSRTTKILGVKCVVVRDLVKNNGRPVEKSLDWYAQDKHGNVWYFGEASSRFTHGHFKHVPADSWRGGVHGAKPGIIMEAHPRKGDVYFQERARPTSVDKAKVLGYRRTLKVPFGTFHRVLKTKEFTPLDRNDVDHDFYARGIGELKEVIIKGGSGSTKLVSIKHLH